MNFSHLDLKNFLIHTIVIYLFVKAYLSQSCIFCTLCEHWIICLEKKSDEFT